MKKCDRCNKESTLVQIKDSGEILCTSCMTKEEKEDFYDRLKKSGFQVTTSYIN